MSYIWKDYSDQNTFRIAYEGFCPYLEIYNDENKNDIKVNVLIRFADIFKDMNFFEQHSGFDNILLHFLAQLDLQKGIYKSTIETMIIREDIEKGLYGKNVKNMFDSIDIKKQEIILKYILKDVKNKQKRLIFVDVVKEIFKNSCFIYSKSTDKFILHIGDTKNCERKIIIDLLKELFLDVFFDLYITWENGIGIIDLDETMIIDSFIIY